MRRKHRPMRIHGKKKVDRGRIPTAPPSKIFENKRKKRPKHKKKLDFECFSLDNGVDHML
tara:strand:- start:54 stop:233 length:180 start_codon:yes stop_codon:yes gene_type:complete